MNAILQGAFFKTPVDIKNVVAFLVGKGLVEDLCISPQSSLLDGVCDSRNGGFRRLVFSSLEQFLKGVALSESLVLIDEIPDELDRGTNQFCKVGDPRAAYIDVLAWLMSSVGVDPHWRGFTEAAAISPEADIAGSAVIEPGVEIGAESVICAGAVIKTGTKIGERTIIRENVVIGSDGVTVYRTVDGRLLKFPHIAGVQVGNRTEIGANAVIAGGILVPTYIGSDVVIGNLCNIGHGVIIENGIWMSVGSLIGGHTTVHAGATIAMGVVVRDNLVIGEEASAGMGSVVVKNVGRRHTVFGNPAKRMPGLKTGPKR